MIQHTYEDLLNQARLLPPDEQLQLLEDLASIIRQQVKSARRPKHSIKEFRGLGKELWQGIDVEKYIEEEHNSWGG